VVILQQYSSLSHNTNQLIKGLDVLTMFVDKFGLQLDKIGIGRTNGSTIIHDWVIGLNQLDQMLTTLMPTTFDINVLNADGESSLNCVCRRGNGASVLVHLKHGAKPTTKTPLEAIVKKLHVYGFVDPISIGLIGTIPQVAALFDAQLYISDMFYNRVFGLVVKLLSVFVQMGKIDLDSVLLLPNSDKHIQYTPKTLEINVHSTVMDVILRVGSFEMVLFVINKLLQCQRPNQSITCTAKRPMMQALQRLFASQTIDEDRCLLVLETFIAALNRS
jgi:hypothetical protein